MIWSWRRALSLPARSCVSVPRRSSPARPAHLALAHDLVMAAVAFLAGLFLRLGPEALERDPSVLVGGTALFTCVAAGVFLATRLNRGVWRYASLDDVFAILRAASLTV